MPSEPPTAPFNRIPTRAYVHRLRSAVVDGRTGRVALLSDRDAPAVDASGDGPQDGRENKSYDKRVSAADGEIGVAPVKTDRECFVKPEDLCVILGVRLFEEERAPAFSLDPADRNDPSGPRTRATHMPEKGVADTFLGQMMYEADHHLKHLNFGLNVKEDGSLARFRSSVPEFVSTSDVRFARLKDAHARDALDAKELAEPSYNRKWIVIGAAREEEQGDTLHFPGMEMAVDTRVMVPDPTARMGLRDVESADDPDSNEFCRIFGKHYDQLEAEAAQLGHVREMSKLVGLVDWIEERGWGVNLARLREIVEAADPCPSTREIKTVYDRQRGAVGDAFITQILCGGVDLAACKDKEQGQAKDHDKIVAEGKYTEGAVGKGTLEAIDALEAALESSPDDSEEAAELKKKLRAEAAEIRAKLASGEPISEAEAAALGERLSALAAEAAAADGAPADVALLAARISGLGGAMASARHGAAGSAGDAEAARAAAAAAGHKLAEALAEIAARAGTSDEARGGVQRDTGEAVARHPKVRAGGDAVKPEDVAALIADAEAAKERHALSDDADTQDLVAEIEKLIGEAEPVVAAAAATIAASGAAVAAANRSRNEDATERLAALTTSPFSDDPEDAKAFRAELDDLLKSNPAATASGSADPAATDKFLADLAALEAKHGAAAKDGPQSEELKEAVRAAGVIRADRAAHVHGRDADAFVAAARAIAEDRAVYPTDQSEEAAALAAELARALDNGGKGIKTPADVAMLRGAMCAAAARHPGRNADDDPQLARMGAALDALAVNGAPVAPPACGLAPGDLRARARELGDPNVTKDAAGDDAGLALQKEIAAIESRTAGDDDALADALRALSRAKPAVPAGASGAAGPVSEGEAAIRGHLAALVAAAEWSGDRAGPERIFARAKEISDPEKFDNGGSEKGAALQAEIAAAVAAAAVTGEDGKTPTPEDAMALRGTLAAIASKARRERERDAAQGGDAAAADAGRDAVLAALDALVDTDPVSSSDPPADADRFAASARALGDPARTDAAGSERAGALQGAIAAAVADADGKAAEVDGKPKYSAADAARLRGSLEKVLREHTPGPNDTEARDDAKAAALRGALAGLLASGLPAKGAATRGPDGEPLRKSLDALAARGSAEGAPEDAREVAGFLRAAALAVPEREGIPDAAAETLLAQMRGVSEAQRKKLEEAGGGSAEAAGLLDSLDAEIASLAASVGARRAAERAAVAAGLAAGLAGVMALAAPAGPSVVEVGDLRGDCVDLLRCGQFARGALSKARHGKRGGEKSKFGCNPRFLVRDAEGRAGKMQIVLNLERGADLAATGRPFLYVFRAGAFAPSVKWWAAEDLVDAKQRVAGRQVRVDLEMPDRGSFVVVPCTENASDVKFTITAHSEGAVHVSPIVWVPRENPPAAITVARGDFAGDTVDVLQPTWHANRSVRLNVTRACKIYAILRPAANTGVGIRIDLARADDAAATALEEGKFTIVDKAEKPSYDALPEIHRKFELSEPGAYFLVPSTIKGTESAFEIEIYGAHGSFEASSPSANAVSEISTVAHDATVVPSSIGTEGHVTF